MPNYAIMRWAKIKSFASANALVSHYDRKKEQAFENKEIVNPKIDIGERPDTYMKFVKEQLGKDTKIRKNAVLGLDFILTYSPGAIDAHDTHKLYEWTKANLQWLEKEFETRDNIFKMSLHLQEATPHLHCLVMPRRTEDNKLSCRNFINSRESLVQLQDSYAKAMEPFGLERGISRTETKKFHKDVRTWRQEQVKLMEEKQEELAQREKSIEHAEDVLERQMLSIEEQKDVLEAVNKLMAEDLDLHIRVHAEVGKNLMPETEISRQKKPQHNLDHDELVR